MASKRSEDVYGQKVDRCMYNALIKLVSGVGIGIVVSAFLFKRKPWPVILGAGLGTGMGISDCNHEFKGHVPVKPVPVEPKVIFHKKIPLVTTLENKASPVKELLTKKPKFIHRPKTDVEKHSGKKFMYREIDDDDDDDDEEEDDD
ncbi:MICOS complex subunit Mic10-like isoform X1 [Biomphalaria glabrata]|uniref:MICOS complex subunit MIC10 n=1 Tax=Biomphalaria glabrata TaxID=6526 RepID=A0A9W2YMU6_BIOGL|nr:MICOS complex subunit Mic10-like isoform X1 [Biomphalaria glabrata]